MQTFPNGALLRPSRRLGIFVFEDAESGALLYKTRPPRATALLEGEMRYMAAPRPPTPMTTVGAVQQKDLLLKEVNHRCRA